MVNFADVHDAGARLKAVSGLAPQTVTAGGSNDDADVNGISVDRFALDPLYQSLKVAVPYSASVQGGETVDLSLTLQTSEDGSNWTDYDDKDGNTTVTNTLDDSAGDGVLEVDYDIGGAAQYIRAVVRANFSAGTTDDIDLGVVHVLAGADKVQT